jgi:hypothetical protein
VIRSVLEAFRQPEFVAGLRPGLVALAIGALVGGLGRLGEHSRPVPVAGLLLAGAVVVGLERAGLLPAQLVVGLAVLAGGGLVVELVRLPPVAMAVLTLPGAWMVATRAGLVPVTWIRLLVGATIVVGALLVDDFDARWQQLGAGPVLVALTAGGVYATVPDTEAALVLLGVALPLALLGVPWPLAALGRAGSCVMLGVVVWTAAAGGFGRRSSIVGAVASLGLLVVEPAGRWLAGARNGPFVRFARRWSAVAVLVAVHLVLVLFASRVAGLRRTAEEAAVLAAGALAAAVGVGTLAARAGPSDDRGVPG